MQNKAHIPEVEEIIKELRGTTAGWGYVTDESISKFEDFLREKLTTLVESVREEAERKAYIHALQLVDEHDPNVGMGRNTSPAYWGNTLRKALQALTHTKTDKQDITSP